MQARCRYRESPSWRNFDAIPLEIVASCENRREMRLDPLVCQTTVRKPFFVVTSLYTAIESFRVEIIQAGLDAERRQAMSFSISTLLIRNLHDVFGENDPARRRATIDEIFTEDGAFYEPRGVYRGRDEIDRVAGAIRATHPDFRYQPIAEPEELDNGGRIQWVSGRPSEAPAYAGTDFIIARDGRIAALYLFFDKLP
jgi:hypothetical protein